MEHHFNSAEQQKDASTVGMWVFLVTEIMFFGGLFLAYVAYRHSYPLAFAAASERLDIRLGAFNTAVLICSSLTMALAVHAAAVGASKKVLVGFLILTLVLGCVFLGVKSVEYYDKYEKHEIPGPNFEFHEGQDPAHATLFFSLYFGMTGLHAFHMIVGTGLLLFLIVQSARGKYTAAWHTPVEMTGLYWHFVDIVWIFLFPLLYLVDRHLK